MDSLFGNATTLLTFLLPGFLSAWVFYGLTSHPKPPQFERTVEALVFTFVVQALVTFTEVVLLLAGRCVVLGTWTESSSLLWGFLLAVLLGAGLALAANKDSLHRVLRRAGFTTRTSHPSEWYCVLGTRPAFVVLQLKDGRRLTGYPKEWPVSPAAGQFYMQMPAWIVDRDLSDAGADPEAGPAMVELPQLDGILIHATDVQWVEILQEADNG
ncbi:MULTISPECIES: DUF6338 family protein [Stenotrophomonas]|uniref:DUF6338 family protein n=1 Tax=Stenotrophomonas TaxID=40323 RepID=UPI0013DC4829|nr:MULTISPECIES: DUF6338 family protein [Stenotrophomonas]